jgi:hypothetical protein
MHRVANTIGLVFTLLAATGCVAAHAAEFHVATSGDDGNPGTAERPFATLGRAQQALRTRPAGQAATVLIGGGTYYLSEPLIFAPEDSGTADAPVVFAAAAGETVVISGGARLELAWRPFRDGIYQADTPAGLAIDQLFVNGQSQPMARYPNFDPEVPIYNGYAADAFSPQRAASWSNPVGGYIHAMHRAHWGGYHYRITGKTPDGSVVYEGGWQNNRQMGMHNEHRFVENVFEELDAPGEWYHDAAKNVLTFYPPDALKLDEAIVETARLRHLIEFRGDQQSPVRHLQLRGLTFRHAARTFMDTKEPLLRSDWTIYRGGAVFYEGAEDCELADCVFDQVGGNAVLVNNYNRRIAVRGCLISDSGASGVVFVGDPAAVRNPLFEYHQRQSYDQIDKTPGPQSDNYPADCLVEDCLIRRIGRVEKQVAGVQISMAARIIVRHCSIYETPRAGINISEGTFGGHVIEFCDVFDTVLETGDHGSFNSWGRDRFWELKDVSPERLPELALLDMAGHNVIRNSRWRCDHGWDIDLDDGSSSYHVVNNLMLHGGLKFREGFHRIAENNIMVNNTFHPHVWYPNSQDIVRSNIVFAPYRPIRVPQPWGTAVDHNLLHQPGVTEPQPAAVLQQQSGRDAHSVVADARFVDPASGDYRVREGSPALELGFQNFPMDQFGVQKPELKAIARTPVLPGLRPEEPQGSAPPQKVARIWLQATVRELEGEEFSAFGVSKDAGGVHLAEVPDGSEAAAGGLKTNDVVQSVDGQPGQASGGSVSVAGCSGRSAADGRLGARADPDDGASGRLSVRRHRIAVRQELRHPAAGRAGEDARDPRHPIPASDGERTAGDAARRPTGRELRPRVPQRRDRRHVPRRSRQRPVGRLDPHLVAPSSRQTGPPALHAVRQRFRRRPRLGRRRPRAIRPDRRGQHDRIRHRPLPSDQRPARRRPAAGHLPLAPVGRPPRHRPPRKHRHAGDPGSAVREPTWCSPTVFWL